MKNMNNSRIMMKMKTGGMVNPNAAVKAATSTKNQIGGGNAKFSAQTSAPRKPAKSKTQPAPKRGGK